MKIVYRYWPVIIVLLIIACQNNSGSKAPSKETTEAVIPEEKEDKLNFQELYDFANQESLEIYNGREQQLMAAPNIEKLGARAFLTALLGNPEEGISRKILNGNKSGLIGDESRIFFIVIEKNLPDDSISSDIRFFELRRIEKKWNLAAVSSVWKCYPGRGHQDYSTERCQ